MGGWRRRGAALCSRLLGFEMSGRAKRNPTDHGEGTAVMRSRAGAPACASARAALLRPVWVAALVGMAIVVAGLLPASTAASAPRGLVAAYGFEEGSGSQVADASGYGNGGAIANATWVRSGAYGRALSFNGSDAVVTVD